MKGSEKQKLKTFGFLGEQSFFFSGASRLSSTQKANCNHQKAPKVAKNYQFVFPKVQTNQAKKLYSPKRTGKVV
jgi:hypothetical protein